LPNVCPRAYNCGGMNIHGGVGPGAARVTNCLRIGYRGDLGRYAALPGISVESGIRIESTDRGLAISGRIPRQVR
jgi:hypothetical protein